MGNSFVNGMVDTGGERVSRFVVAIQARPDTAGRDALMILTYPTASDVLLEAS